jgi:hypothetical protein
MLKALLKWIGIFFGLLVATVLVLMAFAFIDSNRRSSKSVAYRPDPPAPSVTAIDLARAYEANTVAADQTFKGKRFRVNGTVASIATDFTGAPFVTLAGGVNPFMEPQFSFGKADASWLAALRKGDSVTLECTGKGDIAKKPMSDGCTRL